MSMFSANILKSTWPCILENVIANAYFTLLYHLDALWLIVPLIIPLPVII